MTTTAIGKGRERMSPGAAGSPAPGTTTAPAEPPVLPVGAERSTVNSDAPLSALRDLIGVIDVLLEVLDESGVIQDSGQPVLIVELRRTHAAARRALSQCAETAASPDINSVNR